MANLSELLTAALAITAFLTLLWILDPINGPDVTKSFDRPVVTQGTSKL